METERLRSPSELPPRDTNAAFGGCYQSVFVLGYTNRWRVVYYVDYDGSKAGWFTDCADGWNVTHALKGWVPLPPKPEIEK